MTCQLLAGLSTLRFTRLDSCGKPVVGTDNAIVIDCLSSISMEPEIDTQDDIIYRAANGNLCGVKRGCPSLLGYNVSLNVYSYSADVVSILTGNPEVVDGAGATVGFDDCTINCQSGFAVEGWVELIQPCPTTGRKQYLYILLPWVTNGYLDALEIGSEAVTFSFLGNTRAGGQWEEGPFNVIDTGVPPVSTPSPMLTPLGATCHRRTMIVDLAPPAATCLPIAVPAPAP